MNAITPGNQYLKVLEIIKQSDEPIDRLSIARSMGYKSASAVYNSLKGLERDGFIGKSEFVRPNGCIKFYYYPIKA